ncbi:TIGR02584 family CRISPR-associated protein [candidate division KSB1 bacterium]|nr:MAG: TIGR02584 family CRISPR-associated protein [candidate division KSB1 bacterium]
MQNVLIAVTGLTPQVITETLYYFTQVRKPPLNISEVYVITTLKGRKAILKSLLDNSTGKYFQFLNEYDINPESILFDDSCIYVARDKNGNMIKDIRTTEDSKSFANFILQIIKRKTLDEDKAIIASVAGGRKTMSVYLAYAMQLFGRPQDILTHVLVSEEFELHPEFYYIPRNPKELKTKDGSVLYTQNAKIELAEIPFIRLRDKLSSIFGESEIDFEDMVRFSQNELDLIKPVLYLNLKISERKVEIGENSFSLPPLLFSIYYFLVNLKLENCKFPEKKVCSNCDSCFITINDIMEDSNLDRILSFYEEIFRPDSIYCEKLKNRFEKKDQYLPGSFREYFSKINREINKSLGDNKEPYIISSTGKYGAKKYGVKIEKSKIKIMED